MVHTFVVSAAKGLPTTLLEMSAVPNTLSYGTW